MRAKMPRMDRLRELMRRSRERLLRDFQRTCRDGDKMFAVASLATGYGED